MRNITVVGAGFSGMTLAFELAKRGFQVDLHEKSARLGGLLQTQKTHHGLVETAANALIWSSALEQLCNDIGVKPVKALASSSKRFFFRGKPTSWPLNIFESLQFLVRLIYSFITGKFFLKIPAGQSVFQWSEQRLGKKATEYILAPGLQGIYAGDIQKLSANLILAPLLGKKRSKYGGSVSGPEGLQDIIDALEKKLISLGVKIHFNSTFKLDNSQTTVLATSVTAAAELLASSFPVLSHQLNQIETTALISVTVFWKKNNGYVGFGCLIPRSEKIRTLGVLMNTYIFPKRDKEYSETYILGGASDPNVMQLSDAEIKNLILRERGLIFRGQNELLSMYINRWPQALPQYTVPLEKILPQLQLPQGLYLHGNYLGVIGLSKILDRSIVLAESIEKAHG